MIIRSQRCLEAECVAKWDRYQKTLRRQYWNQGQILTNERQTQSTPDIKNVVVKGAKGNLAVTSK